jgi:hypothetical protein
MKLKQIDFNPELIGQDGIVVKTMDGKDVKQLFFFKCANKYPLMGVVDGGLVQWPHDGKFHSKATVSDDLIMYKEVKVMTVDEFYYEFFRDADYSFRFFRQFARELAAAVKAGEVE